MSSPSLIDSEKSSIAANPLSKRLVMCSNSTVAIGVRVRMCCAAATVSNVTACQRSRSTGPLVCVGSAKDIPTGCGGNASVVSNNFGSCDFRP